ncbi:hypothetical protein GH714_016715 [Hevea brasiliensis]|uniref:Uncharacterized protein n=1 Tax=Hevea brasiliensis TaxID=3981 RepID=A0A6A6NHZ6_HEVBR|nr:hypothetical protein GH714_016715 [Hevea brasiliensis]
MTQQATLVIPSPPTALWIRILGIENYYIQLQFYAYFAMGMFEFGFSISSLKDAVKDEERNSIGVVDAMRQTVTNMIGTLPPQFFAVTVTTVAENLAQLMYSVMMTGYMFKNAQYRLELQQSLEQVALPDMQDKKDLPDYAPGTQKNVSGEVIRWNNVSGPQKMDAKKYIELLEAEIEELNRQVGRKTANGQNELLEYLKSLEPQNLKELTSSAGEDVVLAMNTFIKRLLAVADPEQMKTSVTETSALELAKLLYWLMVVGYSIRNIEVRFDMERSAAAIQRKFPIENSGNGGTALRRRFTAWIIASGLLKILTRHLPRSADTTSTRVGFLTLKLVSFTCRLAMVDASNKNLLVVTFIFLKKGPLKAIMLASLGNASYCRKIDGPSKLGQIIFFTRLACRDSPGFKK